MQTIDPVVVQSLALLLDARSRAPQGASIPSAYNEAIETISALVNAQAAKALKGATELAESK
jgi:hypothetical protein